ncbi:MAG TPA: hypothetical protein VHY91_05330 [Pirellulales bacterium]|nr:hypothetical protein [Pirellulales bacterium]
MNARRAFAGFLLAAGFSWLLAEPATAAMARPFWRQRQEYRAPAAAAAPAPAAQAGVTARRGSTAYPSGRSGWNASNTWYTPQASYGNYAPPAYATSRSALIQIGPVPALGGVRSLSGWGGAR